MKNDISTEPTLEEIVELRSRFETLTDVEHIDVGVTGTVTIETKESSILGARAIRLFYNDGNRSDFPVSFYGIQTETLNRAQSPAEMEYHVKIFESNGGFSVEVLAGTDSRKIVKYENAINEALDLLGFYLEKGFAGSARASVILGISSKPHIVSLDSSLTHYENSRKFLNLGDGIRKMLDAKFTAVEVFSTPLIAGLFSLLREEG